MLRKLRWSGISPKSKARGYGHMIVVLFSFFFPIIVDMPQSHPVNSSGFRMRLKGMTTTDSNRGRYLQCFSDECLHPGRSCCGRDSMEEAVVYRKALITPGLDADTQTPAGMRHRFRWFSQTQSGTFSRKPKFFFNNVRPFADGDIPVPTELNDGADVTKGSHRWKK